MVMTLHSHLNTWYFLAFSIQFLRQLHWLHSNTYHTQCNLCPKRANHSQVLLLSVTIFSILSFRYYYSKKLHSLSIIIFISQIVYNINAFFRKSDTEGSVFGYLLLLASLICDGGLGLTEDIIIHTYKPSPFLMMNKIILSSLIFSVISKILTKFAFLHAAFQEPLYFSITTTWHL